MLVMFIVVVIIGTLIFMGVAYRFKRTYVCTARAWALLILIWVSLATGVALVIGSLNVPFFYKLLKDGKTTEAVITQTTPQNHCEVVYRFIVDGNEYQRSDTDHCTQHVGARVTIYYYPEKSGEPSERTSYDPPREALFNELIPIFLAAIFVPTLSIWSLLIRNGVMCNRIKS
jgi:hypothetical protein